MPHITIWEENGIYWKYSGVVTLQEVFEANNEMYGNPKFDHISYQIVDFLEVDKLDFKDEDVAVPAATDFSTTTYVRPQKIALVANALPIRVLCHSYIEESLEMGSPWQFQLFHTLEEAREWAMK